MTTTVEADKVRPQAGKTPSPQGSKVPTTVAELAAKAADLIEARGWTQRDYTDRDGCLCVQGAVNAVAYGDPRDEPYGWHGDSLPIHERLYEEIARRTGYDAPFKWNDEPGRTKDEVINLLRQIAADQ